MRCKEFVFALLVSILALGCMSKQEQQDAKKYGLEYVYFDKEIELKNKPYSMVIDFLPKYDSLSKHFVINLYYFNANLGTESFERISSDIKNSLLGFTVKVLDKEKGTCLYSSKITKNTSLGFSLAETFALNIGAPIKIMNNHQYEVKIDIPAKRDTKTQYKKVIFVVGIMNKPAL